MIIDTEILLQYGALLKNFEKNEAIFYEDDIAKFYFQIAKGKVKMCNINEEGKQFVQGIFSDGDSFGEPPLLIQEKYPASAIALCKTSVYKISEHLFYKILQDYPHYKDTFLKILAFRCVQKANTSRDIINQRTDHRILSFLNDFKRRKGSTTKKILVPYTRQEIADFTGLRVETVIRCLLLLHKNNQVQILKGKVYY